MVYPKNVNKEPNKKDHQTTFKERTKINLKSSASQNAKIKSNHFDEILKYLTEKRRLIYIKTQSKEPEIQRKGIEQWDKMEILLGKVYENKDNKDYLNQLYKKILQLKAKENDMTK